MPHKEDILRPGVGQGSDGEFQCVLIDPPIHRLQVLLDTWTCSLRLPPDSRGLGLQDDNRNEKDCVIESPPQAATIHKHLLFFELLVFGGSHLAMFYPPHIGKSVSSYGIWITR